MEAKILSTEGNTAAMKLLSKSNCIAVKIVEFSISNNSKLLALAIYVRSPATGTEEVRLISFGSQWITYQCFGWNRFPNNSEDLGFEGIQYFSKLWSITPEDLIASINKEKPNNW